MRSREKPARPNIWRLSILIRLAWPSTAPELQGKVSPAMTASQSRSMPAARVMKAGEVVAADGVEPLRKTVALALGEHFGEGPDVAGEGFEFRAVGQDFLQSEVFGVGEGLWPAENPPGDSARCWRLGGVKCASS